MDVRIERIRRALDKADRLEADAETLKWQAAKDIAEEVAAGTKQVELARRLGRSATLVSGYAAVWARWGAQAPKERPSFSDAAEMAQFGIPEEEMEAYREEAKERGVTAATVARDARGRATPEQVVEVLKKNPAAARKVIDDPDAFRQIRRAESVKHQEEEEGFRKRVPEFHNLEAFDAVERALDRMLRTLDEAIREVSRAPGNKKLFALVDTKLVAAEGKLDMLRAVLNAGPVDEELQKILDGGA